MKKYILLICFYSILYSESDNMFYISPGIQIGINTAGDFFFSGQITSGVCFGSCGTDEAPLFIGTTFGRRFYYNRESRKFDAYNYIDGQVSLMFFGLGIGNIGNQYERYSKFKLFVGAWGLLSYDYITSPRSKHHFGLFGVMPIPFDKEFFGN